MTQDRIDRIEEQIAHLSRAVDDLSDMLREQGEALARLQRQALQLIEREAERDLSPGGTAPMADQKPPHW